MKGKKFIAIMAIFIILCSIQAITALEDNNVTQTDVQPTESNTLGISEVIASDIQSNESQVQNNDANDTVQKNDLDVSNSTSSSATVNSEILGVSNDNDLLGEDPKPGPRPWGEWTPGTLVYGVDYDRNQAGNSTVPLDRFFKSIFWGIRDYLRYDSTATKEWNVFLNNKTFIGDYGDTKPATDKMGYNSYNYNERVYYLGLTRLGGYNTDNIEVTIHLYGGNNKNDGSTSTLDLTNYGVSYALLDFGSGNSSITGINFKNFDVNKHTNTMDSTTTVPFIKVGDANNPSWYPERLIHNCTFENITLNPNQPLYAAGQVLDLHFNTQTVTDPEPTLNHLIKFIFWGVRNNCRNTNGYNGEPTKEYNIFLDNNTFAGYYGTIVDTDCIETGYRDNSENDRAKYITFKYVNLVTEPVSFTSINQNITIYIYGGNTKTDGKKSTIDLSQYAADYKFIDLSGGASNITGVNFKNYDANKYGTTQSDTTSMPFIYFGDNKIQNYKSSLINCSFENITLNKKQPLVRMAYIDSPQDSSVISESGGLIDGCVFRDNHASQMVAIAGSKDDSSHSDKGPIFYGFKANNNLFVNNKGTMEYDSDKQSLGLCMKIWNEAFNVTLNNNNFTKNTNAVHGAAYCIIGFNATVTNNYFEGNEAVFGAGIEAHNGNITIKNCTFINNVAKGNHTQLPYRDGSGAGIALLGCNNYISNCTFINNTAHGHAGAIDIVGGYKNESGIIHYLVANNTTIEHSNFTDNRAMDYAGGVHVNGTNTLIDNCTFKRNNASFAGAVRLIGENTTIINSLFSDNNAIQGGACYIEGENARIMTSNFNDNYATRSVVPGVRDNASLITAGGAIYIIGNNTVVTNNNFTNNAAVAGLTGTLEGLGGALYMDGKNITFSKDNFANNYAVQGGAAYINGNDIQANIMNFTANRAVQGGAVYIKGNNTKINKVISYANNATDGINSTVMLNPAGGAILIVGYNSNISNGNFTKNYAVKGNGGAIAIDGHSANITSNDFDKNEAIKGGAIYINSTSTYSNIIGANFTKNKAVEGGAIYILGSLTNIDNANFTDNNATNDLSFHLDTKNKTRGGAIAIDGNRSKIYNATFSKNTAVGDLNCSYGGAIAIDGNSSKIYNAKFSKNTAVGNQSLSYGGAIAIEGNNTELNNTDFEFNQAILGGAIYYKGSLNDILDTEFRNNSAIQGGALYIDKSDATFGKSRFYNNSATHELRFTNSFNNTPTMGGAINIPGNGINVYDSEFINNTAYGINANGGLGGAIAVNGSDDIIKNSTFENNQAINGGAFFLNGNKTRIMDSNFTNNRAIQGGVGYINGSDSLVEKSKFNDNYATHTDLRFSVTDLADIPTEGGAIHIIGENIKITSSEFNDNVADAKTASENSTGGGAVYIEGINATISNSTFDNNTALKGGAIYVNIEETKVIGCNFTDNSAFNYTADQGLGGAVYLDKADNTEIKESGFVNNVAGVNGGAVYWAAPFEGKINGRIIDSVFENNSAAANAGAVFWYGCNGTIIGSNFTNNRANGTSQDADGNSGNGGAIIWTGSDGSLKDCTFENNYAKHNGGAVLWEADEGNISDSTFDENSADENGGAVFWEGMNGRLKNSNFTSNNATQGGAVYWSGLNGEISGSRFISNNATYGGAIFLENGAAEQIGITITDSYFETNTAVDGGAINWNRGNEVTIVKSNFTENTADSRGGAVFVNGTYGNITDSQFTSNEAILGGAVYLNNEELTVSGSEFTTNNAVQGGAVYIGGRNYVISDSYFNYNNATYSLRVDTSKNKDKTKGGAIYIGGENNVIEDSEFTGNVANATNDTAVIVQTTPGLLGAYLDVTGVKDDGLGGAIFIGANGNNITGKNEFMDNIARNGSAVYNDASGTYFKGGTFYRNQAWSYVLEVNGTNKTCCKDNIINKIYYGADVEIKLYNYIAGDNILNGIYNAGNVGDVTFNSVGYIINDDTSITKTTVASDTNPVLGAQEGMLYQDSLERYQRMVITVRCNETGEIVANKTVLTDLYGNYSFDLVGLNPGNYTIVAYHPEDMNYKYIITANVFEVVPLVDLSIKKSIAEDPILVGDNAVFTIVVSNAANASEATNVIVNEVLPNGLTVVDVNASVGTYDSSTNVWHIDKLANGTRATLVLTARTSQVGLFNNTVIVSCDEEEWNYTNNNDTLEFDVIAIVNLNIVKTVDDNDTEIGDFVTFTIEVTNKGPSNATDVVINDILPNGLKLISGQLDHVVPFLAKDESYSFNIVAQTTQKGSFTNHVNVTCAENDTVKSANATVDVYVVDLKIHKNANVTEAHINGLVNFTIVVRDHGNDEATNVRISDVLPHEFEFVSASGNYIRNHQNIVWIIDRLPAEQDYTVWIVARALINGTFDNVAHVNCSEEPAVKNSTATVKVLNPVSLNVTKVANDDDFAIGDEVTFTITVTNLGEENATNIVIEDMLPNGLALSEGYSLNHTIALLRGGESVNVTIRARTTATGAYTNVVSVYCRENSTRVSDNTTVNVYEPDLKINKTANVTEAHINGLVNFTIVVTNHGNDVATIVRISDVLPDGFEFVSAGGNYVRDGQNIVWIVDSLPAYQDYTVWIVAKALTNGIFDNVAHVNCSEEPTVKNSTATVKVLKPVTLDIVKVANDNDFAIGDEVTFTITITNAGDENATFVLLRDVLPEGLTLVEGYLLEHIYPHLNGGESVSVIIKAITTRTGAFTNVASVYSSENPNPVSDNTTINVYEPDLKIHKSANVTQAFINDLVNFTIVVTNHGNDLATIVRISDVLPDGFEFVSAGGNYNRDGQNIVWIVDRLPAYQDYTVWIVAKALTNGTFDNVAHVNCSEEPTVKNSTANVTVYNPSLSVVKVTLDEVVYSGNKVSFKIIVTNEGDIELNNVFVEEMIPEGLIYDTYIGSNWIKNEDIFYYEHSLGVGESVELIVVVNTTVSGIFTNNIVAGADNVDNCDANANVTVYAPSLTVREISNDPNVIVGTPVSFTVVVTNDGDCVLGDVYVSNIFPEGLIYTGFEGENWTKVGDRFVYSGVLNPGESISYILYFNTTVSGVFVPEVIAGSNMTSNATSKAYSNNTTVVSTPSLTVREISNDPNVIVGAPVSFTVVVTNDGDCVLGDVYVSNIFPEGLIYTGFEGENWSKVGDRFVYSGVLNPGESISYTLYFNTTKEGVFVPEVIAGSNLTSNATSKAYSNNSTTVITVPDIALIKVADKTTVTVGELVTFNITVLNCGTAVLNGIYVIDELPDGLEFVSFAGDGWSKVGNAYYYSGSLAPGESVSFTIVCNATKVCNVTNVATVFSDMAGNVSANADVSIIGGDQPVDPVEPVVPVEPDTPQPDHVPMDSKATGNPIMMLLLIILLFIPLRRRRN